MVSIITILNVKGSFWLKYFGHSNSLCVRATRAIVNHVPIGKYRLRFFPQDNFSYLCSSYLLESRHDIHYEYRRFNAYQNLRRNLISHFILFLEFNSNVFLFGDAITQSSQLLSLHNLFFSFFGFQFLFILFCFLSHVDWFFLYIVTQQLLWSVFMLYVINC